MFLGPSAKIAAKEIERKFYKVLERRGYLEREICVSSSSITDRIYVHVTKF